jgi:hypothetical protein
MSMTAGEITSLIQTIVLIFTLIATTVISIINLKKADSAEKRIKAIGDSFAESLELIAKALGKKIGVRWTVTWVKGDSYELENTGDEDAVDVVMRSDKTLGATGTPDDFPIAKVRPGDSFSFMASRSMVTTDLNIYVSWKSESGEELNWNWHLPSRPKRGT